MIHWLMSLLGALTERRFRDFSLGIGAVAVVALLGVVALGFGTLAAYVYFCASQGVVGAALIICFAYALLAILIGAAAMIRRRAERLPRGAVSAPTPAPSENIHSFFQGLPGAGAPKDREALLAAMQIGRELAPLQLLAIALISGFIVGRKLFKLDELGAILLLDRDLVWIDGHKTSFHVTACTRMRVVSQQRQTFAMIG